MNEDSKTHEGQDGLEGKDGPEVSIPQSQRPPAAEAPVEPTPESEKLSAEVVSNPPSPSNPPNPPEALAKNSALNPTNGESWEAITKEVGKDTS